MYELIDIYIISSIRRAATGRYGSSQLLREDDGAATDPGGAE